MVTLSFLFPNHLTFEVAWHAGDMNPAAVTLPYQLREAYLPRLLHLLYDLEQPTMVSLLPSYSPQATVSLTATSPVGRCNRFLSIWVSHKIN